MEEIFFKNISKELEENGITDEIVNKVQYFAVNSIDTEHLAPENSVVARQVLEILIVAILMEYGEITMESLKDTISSNEKFTSVVGQHEDDLNDVDPDSMDTIHDLFNDNVSLENALTIIKNKFENINKISKSIQFQLTNVAFLEYVFKNTDEFKTLLEQGPDSVKEYLFNEWNRIKSELEKDDRIIVKDKDKEITNDSFDITANTLDNGVTIYYFIFPDYEFADPASKCVAVILTDTDPRFINMEYQMSSFGVKRYFTFGEFKANEDRTNFVYENYGELPDESIEQFAHQVVKLI